MCSSRKPRDGEGGGVKVCVRLGQLREAAAIEWLTKGAWMKELLKMERCVERDVWVPGPEQYLHLGRLAPETFLSLVTLSES